MQWTLGTEPAEARKLNIICQVHPALYRPWTGHCTITQIDHAANNRIIFEAFFRVSQHIVSAIDTLHLDCALRPCQVGMVPPCQLSISLLYCALISIYWNA